MELGKYSFGTGDRFAKQGEAQLEAMILAAGKGVDICPVWNKSNREHLTIKSKPESARLAADQAVKALGWDKPYFLDADHINLTNVDGFIEHCNFFTIDVADYIGKKASDDDMKSFLLENEKFIGELQIPGIEESFEITAEMLKAIGEKFLFAVKQASAIYQHILMNKKNGPFVTEVSMDEVMDAQSPVELFFILSAIGSEKIPVATIAPKFTGRFNKGVDYVGDLDLFEKEFEQDLLVIDFAVKTYGLPANLKLSVHSGSDKFTIYPIMGRLIKKYNKGIHVKTAGTTWLEEAIGMAMAGGEALQLMKNIYFGALDRFEELAGPYATVIDIDPKQLPAPEQVNNWNGDQFANALRHIPGHGEYNPHFRQLMHVAYKLAAETGETYLNLLEKHKDIVGQQVTENIFDRHIKRLFNI
ncbi:MAG: tagaturonate epimerase family protein [Bacteroidales bacterium]|nr:tagaturonate epimerase family protein [Bacteroidales bacterium]